ncbi:MAG: alpha-1,2-mannosyltransferase (Kre5) [Watsoniomyces obsoletus]|nr:MAG: alpha-1,2-mannosyltransferase (Kre5) [Watsoniomyces obsoletus]
MFNKKTFKNPKPAFMNVLRETGPIPNMEEAAANGVHPTTTGKPKKKDAAATVGGGTGGGEETSRKRKRGGVNIDMEKLADGLQKLGEEDLLEVVNMIMTHKTSDTYTKNDVEQGEFHVDLYTLPDSLLRMLWDFTSPRIEL